MKKSLVGIAFHGPMGSGKTTAATYLSEMYGFERMSFAAPLKDLMAVVQSSTPDTLFDDLESWMTTWLRFGVLSQQYEQFFKGAVWGFSMEYVGLDPFPRREFLQRLGTEIGRRIDNSLWIKLMFSQLEDKDRVAVDDVRFPNEVEALLERGFYCIKLQVDPSEQARRLQARDGIQFDASTLHHSSEREVDDRLFHEVWAPKSVVDMHHRLDALVASMLGFKLAVGEV